MRYSNRRQVFSGPAWLVMTSVVEQYWGGFLLPSSGSWSINLSQFVYTLPPRILLLLRKRKRWIFNNCGVILTIIILVVTSIIFTMVFRSHTRNWSKRLAKGPYQKNIPPAVGLEPEILSMQTQTFWTILAHGFMIDRDILTLPVNNVDF